MAKKSCGSSTLRGIYISCLHDAAVIAIVQANNSRFIDTIVFWCCSFSSHDWTFAVGHGIENGPHHIQYVDLFAHFSMTFSPDNAFPFVFVTISVFQFAYTGIFGMYSAYLFAKTGHFMAPFVVHAFCNHMGFPDIQEVLNQPDNKKHLLIGLYVIGLVAWIILLPIVTEPKWYSNELYWNDVWCDFKNVIVVCQCESVVSPILTLTSGAQALLSFPLLEHYLDRKCFPSN